jgi:hypothetical protein
VLTLLVASIRSTPAPALGHLLLGFNTEVSPEDWDRTTLHPREEFSCLTVVLQQLMHDPELHLLQPTLHSRMLQLLHIIAEDPATAEPVAHLLVGPQAFAGELLPQLAGLLLQALPGDPQVFVGHQENLNGGSPPDDPGILGLVAALRQRAYIMRIFALLMLRCNDEDVVRQLLGMLLTAGTQGSMYAGSRALPPLLQQLLPHLCKVEAPEASLDRIPLQDQITLDGLPIVKALQQQARLEALGLVTQDWADQVVFNFDELQALLWQWLDQYRMAAQQRGPAAEQEGYAAVIRVYEYAQQQNAWLMVSGGCWGRVTAILPCGWWLITWCTGSRHHLLTRCGSVHCCAGDHIQGLYQLMFDRLEGNWLAVSVGRVMPRALLTLNATAVFCLAVTPPARRPAGCCHCVEAAGGGALHPQLPAAQRRHVRGRRRAAAGGAAPAAQPTQSAVSTQGARAGGAAGWQLPGAAGEAAGAGGGRAGGRRGSGWCEPGEAPGDTLPLPHS